ncbi:MAG: tetratricopeptide repeat protein [Calditrichaeota bacterium]|nr:tetratricopeptide repeat protein [Calditrichota bacterium]
MKLQISRLLLVGVVMLLLGMFGSSSIYAQFDEFEEEELEEVKCKPDTLISGYEHFKVDTVTQQQIAIWYSFGQEEYKYKHYDRAIPYFWRVLMNDQTGKFRVVYSKLADCYFRLNKVDSTLLVVYMGLEKYPNYARLHYWAGFVHDRLGHTKCAIPHYEFLVKQYPKEKDYWVKLAYLYYKVEDPKAIEAQKKVVDLDPKDVEASRLLAEIMTHFGEDPLEALKATFEKDTTNVENALRYGKEAFNVGNYEEALRPFRAILKVDPKNTLAMEYIGRSYEGLNQLGNAIRAYKDILKIEPKNVKVMSLIASVYARMNNFTSARSYVNRAKRLEPNNGLPYMIMAEIYETAVNYCSNKRKKKEFTYDDKLVYRLAAEEYKKAARDPNYAGDAKRRLKQLETLLPTKEDYFMHKNRLKPKDPCYKWINQ